MDFPHNDHLPMPIVGYEGKKFTSLRAQKLSEYSKNILLKLP